MLQRLYAHNYRCLENFELVAKDVSSMLIIGKNGAGKSTILSVLEKFQMIARGTNRVGDLVSEIDCTRGRTSVPIRLRLEAVVQGIQFSYEIAFELPARFKEYRVLQEQLNVEGMPLFSRDLAQVNLVHHSPDDEDRVQQFSMDWHLVAFPLIQVRSDEDPLSIFKNWMARMVLLAPVPVLMSGISRGETLELKRDASNLSTWFTGILSRMPSAYSTLEMSLKELFPDFSDVVNETIGVDAKSLRIRFAGNSNSLGIAFDNLSDGERCLFLYALLLSANKSYGPLFCFWDEPDNFLSLTEVGQLVMDLRRTFGSQGQILVSSHHPESIRKFSDENTLVLHRRSHLEPTQGRLLSDIKRTGDLINSIIVGDIFDELE